MTDDVSKLLISNDFKEIQSLNIPSISFKDNVSKLLKFNIINKLQLLNIFPISLTDNVLKLFISIDVNE